MDRGDMELGACPIFSTTRQLWFFMTAHICGKSPYKSYCFAGHDTRGSQKTVPDSDLLLYLCTCASPRRSTRTAGCKTSPVRGTLGRLFKSKLSARQCVHQNSAWTGPVAYTLKGHLSGRSPVRRGRMRAHRDRSFGFGHTAQTWKPPSSTWIYVRYSIVYHLWKLKLFCINYVCRRMNACA